MHKQLLETSSLSLAISPRSSAEARLSRSFTVTNFSRSDLSCKRLLHGGEQVRGVVAILSITLGIVLFL